MKFGKKLLEQVQLAPSDWAPHYIPYKDLKKILHGIESSESSTIFKAEGDFVSAMLEAIEGVNSFYGKQEADYGARLEALAKTLEKPTEWILSCPALEDEAASSDPDFPRVVEALEAGVHVPQEKRAALDAFLALCAEIDQLRKFSVRAIHNGGPRIRRAQGQGGRSVLPLPRNGFARHEPLFVPPPCAPRLPLTAHPPHRPPPRFRRLRCSTRSP